MRTAELLDRNAFREIALQRDRHQCVICGRRDGLSVHHILERKLFPDGGYYVANASTLCERHHIEAEKTTLSVEAVRQAAGIVAAVLPPEFDSAKRYDKWGNEILEGGQRLKGPMFSDDGCQRILKAAGLLRLFR